MGEKKKTTTPKTHKKPPTAQTKNPQKLQTKNT